MKRKMDRPPNAVAGKGVEALVEKLGPGGALQFIHQHETGRGDYTKERRVTRKQLRAELLGRRPAAAHGKSGMSKNQM
jgi:hypothetical protein